MTVHELVEQCRNNGLCPKEVQLLLMTKSGLHEAVAAHKDEPDGESFILTTGKLISAL